MFPGVENLRVFVRPGATDMRKCINGLSVLVQQAMQQDPVSGALYIFCNRQRKIMKVLYWDRNGFCIWQKKLGEHRFPWPSSEEECLSINRQQLEWLLRGIDFWNEHGLLNYSRVI